MLRVAPLYFCSYYLLCFRITAGAVTIERWRKRRVLVTGAQAARAHHCCWLQVACYLRAGSGAPLRPRRGPLAYGRRPRGMSELYVQVRIYARIQDHRVVEDGRVVRVLLSSTRRLRR